MNRQSDLSYQPWHGHALTDAFDIWLHKGLHQMFDEVACEPIPDELLDLIAGGSEQNGHR